MREVAIAPCLLSHVCACACLHFEKWDNSDHQNVFVACVAKKKKRTSHKVHVHTYFDDCVIFPLCVTSWGKKGIPNKSVSPFMELALLAMAVVWPYRGGVPKKVAYVWVLFWKCVEIKASLCMDAHLHSSWVKIGLANIVASCGRKKKKKEIHI